MRPKRAREALKLDPGRRIPKAEHVLGLALAYKRDYGGALEHMKSYVELAPNAPDIEQVKKQMLALEKVVVTRSGSAAPQQ